MARAQRTARRTAESRRREGRLYGSVAQAAATRGEADRARSLREAAERRRDEARRRLPPGSEPCGRLCGGGGDAAEVEERDGACGPVLVKLNTEVWIWETNTLLLVGFRRSKEKSRV